MPTIYKDLLMKSNDEGLLAYVENTFDNRQLSELIWDTQELRIKDVIGSGLYDELCTQVRGATLTTLNQTLLSYINPALKYFVLADGAHIFTYKIRSKGVQTQSSDNAQPSSMADLDRLVNIYKDRAEVYADRLMKYLLQNSSSYPLYLSPGTGIDTILPKGQQYNIGWYMGNNKNGYNPCANGDQNTIDF